LAFGQAFSDSGYIESDVEHFKEIIDELIDMEYLIGADHLTDSDRRALLKVQEKYVHSHIHLWRTFKSFGDLDKEVDAQISVLNIECAGHIMGMILGSASAAKIIERERAARARAAKTTTNRRARTKEILIGMGAANFSKSRAQASLVRDKVRAQLEIDDPDDAYPSEDTLKDLIREIVAGG